MLNLGFLMRGEIIWVKKGGGAPSTAWGTWMSAKVYGLSLGFIQHIATTTATTRTLANYLLFKGLSC